MGLFNGPWLNKEEHERSIHLNLIGQVNMLNLHNYELQAKLEMAQGRIEELEHEIDNYETTYKGSVVETQAKRIAELEHQLKVECDTYLWKRKLMSRRIAFLQGWMKKLFKYGSSPEARRNQMTMTTEIPDSLIREGEDILHHLEERSDLENGE